jgi:phosphoglycolate phosphatase-like HAD superfamily hydrolase
MKLLLFDIDGTLLHANGTGRTAIERALSDLCDQSISTEGISFSGKTDPQIMREILEANDLEATPSLVDEALAIYEATAHATFDPGAVNLLPGTANLLNRLTALDVHLGLLTGNIESMAYKKLTAVALDRHFAFGAFGSDHADRHCLPPVAVRRAQDHTGRTFRRGEVAIVGDTEHDIRCGQGIGAFSVAVCTGRFTRHELAPHDPDVLLDDLSDPDAFIDAVLS